MIKQNIPIIATGLTLLSSSIPAISKTTKPVKKPNIVFIMADDLGWSDLGIMGSDYYETPNIDSLAKRGCLYTHAYASAANSAPSRACLISGMYTPRHGIFTVSPSDRGNPQKRKFIPIKNTDDLRADFITVAEALKGQGYDCAQIGKWHLGDDADGTGPISQGFVLNIGGDRAGHPYNYFYPYCSKDGLNCHYGLDRGKKDEYLTDRLTSEAIHFIDAHQDKPFFLYLSHYAVHTPLQAPDSLIAKYKAKEKGTYHKNAVYAAMIEKVDDGVGRIYQRLKELGLLEQTIIIFTSDNGGSVPVTNNHPLRGGKGMPYEGGIRIPLIISWLGHIKPMTANDKPVINLDSYPTFVRLAGAKPSSKLDGKDLFSFRKSRDLFWHFPAYLESYTNNGNDFRATPYSIIESKGWKLIHFYETDSDELYNIDKDISEQKELSTNYPKIKKRLLDKLHKWLNETHAPIPTELNPSYQGMK
jgi:arylsulfatase A-like enzyme